MENRNSLSRVTGDTFVEGAPALEIRDGIHEQGEAHMRRGTAFQTQRGCLA